MDDLCVIRVQGQDGQTTWTPCVRADSVRGTYYVRLLLLAPKSVKSPAENERTRGKSEGSQRARPGTGRVKSAKKSAAGTLLSLAQPSFQIVAGDVFSYVLAPVLPPVLPTLIAQAQKTTEATVGGVARPLLIVHSWASVLGWKLLRGVWGFGRSGKAGKAAKAGRGPIII